MIANFFIWCAGSDKNVLSKCEESVRIKHIGLGTLVLIPAIIGFVSMSYALSTIDQISQLPIAYISGGLLWGLIIFAFDRFIVSTHRKQPNNIEEFKNIIFYIRLFFAFIIGILISHPFVLLWFNGSISEDINNQIADALKNEDEKHELSMIKYQNKLDSIESKRNCYLKLLTAEQSGKKVELACGFSSGIPNTSGRFIRTNEIKKIIEKIDKEIITEKSKIEKIQNETTKSKEVSKKNIKENASFDYLKRVVTFEKIKSLYKIASTSERMIIIGFILIDLMPLFFKTFSQYSMYDKILSDDLVILKGINTESRKTTLQKAYDKISKVYEESKKLDPNKNYTHRIDEFYDKYNISRHVTIGILLGIGYAVLFSFSSNDQINNEYLLLISFGTSIITGVIGHFFSKFIESSNKFNNI